MQYTRVYLEAIGYELAPVVITTSELEARLKPLYEALHFQPGQLEALTGIVERRWWEPDTPLSKGAIAAGRKALEASSVIASDIETLIYAGVCRESFEPATACRVAHGVGVSPTAAIYDISNACLGVLNGMFEIANRIELGQIRAGMVVSCETAREINETMIARMLEEKSMDHFISSLATLTGGAGAVAALLTDGTFPGSSRHRLLGGIMRCAPEFHHLCYWGMETGSTGEMRPFMATDSVSVLKHGVKLGHLTWLDFLNEMDWTIDEVDRVICHQVGAEHQKQILNALGVPEEKDFPTYEYLGNIGTVSLPITVALADERGFLQKGDHVAFLGIGSGLNCMMLGLEW